MIRWALKLSEFNIELEHRPGVQNVVADVLSRNPVGNIDGSNFVRSSPSPRLKLSRTTHSRAKWSELIPLRKASAQATANAFFENYISRYGAPISLISDNGPQFISEVF
ncbi:hypothetical protein TNCV_3252361 [Trichonephila clavipes]|nr:hypothetical protein TNCV_3252361 [Trichonephila clavipes]